MALSAIFLLLPTLFGIVSSQEDFYGKSVHFISPQNNKDGTLEVGFYYRENGMGSCKNQLSYQCEGRYCSNLEIYKAVVTDRDSSGQGRWCQSEVHGTAATVNNQSFALRVPQNCFSKLPLLVYDPDGDHVRCLFAANKSVDSNVTLDENQCTIEAKGMVGIGIHVFELVFEDHPTKHVKLTYGDGSTSERKAFNSSSRDSTPFSQIPLQFTLEILPPLPNCKAGHVIPQYLLPTAYHGNIHQASVGNQFQLHVCAQADHAKIYDFQVSGPENMTKEVKDQTFGKAAVVLSWTPVLSELHQLVPVCFTAETNQSQSEMRCVIVMVTTSSEGKAVVKCSATQMTVTLDKGSMPGIDQNWLKMEDPSCSMSSNDTHIMATMSFNTCGTKLEETGNFIVFKNEINSFELPNTVITRRRHVKIAFSCQFPKSVSLSNSYHLQKSDYVFTESSFGSFRYTFEMYNDSSFAQGMGVDAFPMELKLMDMIFMGIRAASDLPNVTLFVESCKATPDDDPENSLFYYLIQNGCVKDETLKVHPSDLTSFNFEVQAFQFIGDIDQMYITCSVLLCETGNPVSRCAQGCLKNPLQRRKRALYKETASHYISQGPLRLLREDHFLGEATDNVISPDTKRKVGAQGLKEVLSSGRSSVVLGSLFSLTVVALAVIIALYVRKSRSNDREVPLITDWES